MLISCVPAIAALLSGQSGSIPQELQSVSQVEEKYRENQKKAGESKGEEEKGLATKGQDSPGI